MFYRGPMEGTIPSSVLPPVLYYPDFTQTFILDTDASSIAIGVALTQNQAEHHHLHRYCRNPAKCTISSSVLPPVLHYPDFTQTFIVDTDASRIGQNQAEYLHP